MCDCPRGGATELCFVKSEIYHFSLDDFDFDPFRVGNVYNGDFSAIEIVFRPSKSDGIIHCCSHLLQLYCMTDVAAN